MRVRIVSYEDINAWILGKFAKRMQACLKDMGIECDISDTPDPTADINHHIIYLGWNGKPSHNDTLMITHVDNIDKLNHLNKEMENAAMGICMSKEHRDYLYQMGNIDKNKICYIDPAQDGIMPIKRIVIGWANKVGPDGRKNEKYLDSLVDILNPSLFKFRIMGQYWGEKVNMMREHGFEVDYFENFDYDEYHKFIPSLDYYLYMGMDEGHMGVLDALAAGVKTIITNQGYHLDLPGGITHGFTTYEELEQILRKIQSEKEKLINSVSDLTWENYTKKHVEIWEYLLNKAEISSTFKDGYNSIIGLNKEGAAVESINISETEKRLRKTLLIQQITQYENNKKAGVHQNIKTKCIMILKKIQLFFTK